MSARRIRRATMPAVIAIAALGLLSVTTGAVAERRPAPPTTARLQLRGATLSTALSPRAARYRAQELTWRGCIDATQEPGLPADYYRLQCATLTAPLDWSDPDEGPEVEIAVSRLKATTRPAAGVLFTNPGGPGAAGVELPLLFVSDARRALLRSQDIYGMDVRGTGDSSNVSCGGMRSRLLDPRQRSTPNLDLLLDSAELTARACDVVGAELIDHVTTPQTVRDLDLLRAVVRAPTVNWLGYSAGTWLGAQYATAYPENVGHMVLDSNVDFTGTWQAALELQPKGFERRFTADFTPWVAKYQAVYGLGSTSGAVQASYERIRAGLRSDVPIESAVTLDQLVAGSLYSKGLFPSAAAVLADLDGFLTAQRTSNVRAMSRARARVNAALPFLRRNTLSFAGDAPDATFLAVTCNDTVWEGGRAGLVQASERLGALSPLLGWAAIDQPCAFWRRPAVDLPVPTGAGVPRVLMVQSDHDPATPIEGARRAAERFTGARLLTVTGEGDHGLYAGGNTCVNKAVERFIVAGKLPVAGATCAGRPLPAPEGSTFVSRADGYAVRAAKPSPATSAGPRTRSSTSSPVRPSTPAVPLPGTNPLIALRLLTALTHSP
jgi:pimeloyl-ACP methyl ester carboxylesterase